MSQKELDEQIKSELISYLNHNNSVSGNNFTTLVTKLNEIKNQWENHCKEYEKKYSHLRV